MKAGSKHAKYREHDRLKRRLRIGFASESICGAMASIFCVSDFFLRVAETGYLPLVPGLPCVVTPPRHLLTSELCVR